MANTCRTSRARCWSRATSRSSASGSRMARRTTNVSGRTMKLRPVGLLLVTLLAAPVCQSQSDKEKQAAAAAQAQDAEEEAEELEAHPEKFLEPVDLGPH